MIPSIANLDTLASSSLVSWIYDLGGRGIKGGGTKEGVWDVGEGGVGVGEGLGE